MNHPSKTRIKPAAIYLSATRHWSYFWSLPRFRYMLVASLVTLYAGMFIITHALAIVNQVNGWELSDPLHWMLPAPMDVSHPIFLLTYLSVFFVLVDVLMNAPLQAVRYAFCIGIMKILRTISFLLVPLEPPQDIIPLIDPLVNAITPNQIVALKDLFFSGHCATMVLLYLIAVSPMTKKWMAAICVIVPLLILWQRVHYTIDVLAGLLIGYLIYKIVNYLTAEYLDLS